MIISDNEKCDTRPGSDCGAESETKGQNAAEMPELNVRGCRRLGASKCASDRENVFKITEKL